MSRPTTASPAGFCSRYLEETAALLARVPAEAVAAVVQMVEEAFEEQRTVFVAGNGGSAASASHFANDLMIGVAKRREAGVRVVALTDNVPLITAIGNDFSFREVFSRQLAGLCRSGDLLIVLSASGNSPNIVAALETAREHRVRSVALLGMDGGRAATLADRSVVVDSNDYGAIEDVHLVLGHLITTYLQTHPA